MPRFADQLEAELGRLGEQTKKDSGHVIGTLRRAWIEIKESYQNAVHAPVPEMFGDRARTIAGNPGGSGSG
jgi:hypothetical protein